MKIIKWLLVSVLVLVLLIGAGATALVYLVDWNDFRDTIQKQTKKHTGRDLTIAGDLKPTVFPWVGVSIGDIALANAEGFGDLPFAKMGSADVKVELLPLLKKEVNIRTVELNGLNLDLQRSADGTTNWDDLVKSSEATTTTTTSTENGDESIEVEGDSAAIAALAVGGISIGDANVSWKDAQSGTDVKLSDFNLNTGAIELAKAFDLNTDFKVASNSMGLGADINGAAQVMLDLDNQVYSLSGLKLTTNAVGDSFPDGKLDATLDANIMAKLSEQKIDVENLSLSALGLVLSGVVNVANLDTQPAVSGKLSSNEFSPLDMFAKLGIEAPSTADAAVLQKASLSLDLDATPASASLNGLTIKLDDTTFSGSAQLPNLAAGGIPPVRFDFEVDAIDLDRYLPPVVEGASDDTATTTSSPAATGDEPIALPLDMMRQLDVDGEFKVGSVKVKNLTTSDIAVPVKAKNGVIAVNGLRASMYQGQLNSNATIDASGNTPSFAVDMNLAGIEADPLLVDLMQKDSFLTGNGQFAAKITTAGNTVNGLTAGLNGGFNTAFNDGSINGVNVGYQIRRAKAALTGQSAPADEVVKTDFSTFSVSGQFVNGVMQSNDLDMRSPLLRLGGDGQVDLPGEYVDYTLTTLITGSAQGQGGEDLESLKGVELDIPIRGSFDELAANFAGVILGGLKDNITNNIKGQVEARAKAEADKLKAEAQAKLKAEEEKARARLNEEKAKAEAKFNAEKARAQEKLAEQTEAAEQKANDALKQGADEVQDKLKGLFK